VRDENGIKKLRLDKELYEAGLRILRQILNRLKFGLIF
jgi:hypothetical protein